MHGATIKMKIDRVNFMLLGTFGCDIYDCGKHLHDCTPSFNLFWLISDEWFNGGSGRICLSLNQIL